MPSKTRTSPPSPVGANGPPTKKKKAAPSSGKVVRESNNYVVIYKGGADGRFLMAFPTKSENTKKYGYFNPIRVVLDDDKKRVETFDNKGFAIYEEKTYMRKSHEENGSIMDPGKDKAYPRRVLLAYVADDTMENPEATLAKIINDIMKAHNDVDDKAKPSNGNFQYVNAYPAFDPSKFLITQLGGSSFPLDHLVNDAAIIKIIGRFTEDSEDKTPYEQLVDWDEDCLFADGFFSRIKFTGPYRDVAFDLGYPKKALSEHALLQLDEAEKEQISKRAQELVDKVKMDSTAANIFAKKEILEAKNVKIKMENPNVVPMSQEEIIDLAEENA